jgi:serine/threonine-protein kinase
MVTPTDPRHSTLRDCLVGQILTGSAGISYHLRECVGEGGQGWVFRANWDDPSGHVVIVKVLRPDVLGSETLSRFKREADVLRMLSALARPNPYIVRFYDHAVTQVVLPTLPEPLVLAFTVLEYVDGTTLEKVLSDQRGRGLDSERTRRLVRQIVHALDAVHAQKVVHRDLKPSNILLATEAGTEIAKVTDFGLVKLTDMNLQRTAALAGASLGYAPPEQYEQGNKRVSSRTDIFSLAAMVFEMLSGKPAFPFNDGENPLLIVTRILNGPRPSLARFRESLARELQCAPNVVEQLDRELARALAADPEKRHASVLQFWSAIEPALQNATKGLEYNLALDQQSTIRAEWPRASVVAPLPKGVASPPRRGRPTEEYGDGLAGDLQPRVWSWRVATPAIGCEPLRAAAFRAAGASAVAVTHAGIFWWERDTWRRIPLADRVGRALSAVRGVRSAPDGSFVLFGDAGFVARITEQGILQPLPVGDPSITFLGAYTDTSGTTTLVGERPSPNGTRGVFVQYNHDRVTLLCDTPTSARLRDVTCLRSGALVACGDWGAIERLANGRVEHVRSICRGHLGSIAALPDGGAVTVGSGGHALSLDVNLDARLESVQTTRDILAVAASGDGSAWAGAAAARLLHRVPSGGADASTWARIKGDLGQHSNFIGVWASPTCVRALGDDGAVVEGRLA